MTEEEFLKQMENLKIDPDFYNIGEPVKDFSLNLLKMNIQFFIKRKEILLVDKSFLPMKKP